MKYCLTFFILNIFSLVYSQCEYRLVEFNNSTEKATIKSYPFTLDLVETPLNGRILLASLIRTGNQYIIELEITQDSSSRNLKPICLESGSRVSFLLKNNSTFSLPHVNDKICGIRTYDRKSGYTTVSNYGKFILTQSSFDQLSTSEITLIKIIDNDFNKSFVLKNELKEPLDDGYRIINPSRFFIDNINCMINPKFE